MVEVLVADSGAFIKAAPLEKWSSHVVTVKEVISEIKDENTRGRLQVLPYKLQLKEPTLSALQHGKLQIIVKGVSCFTMHEQRVEALIVWVVSTCDHF